MVNGVGILYKSHFRFLITICCNHYKKPGKALLTDFFVFLGKGAQCLFSIDYLHALCLHSSSAHLFLGWCRYLEVDANLASCWSTIIIVFLPYLVIRAWDALRWPSDQQSSSSLGDWCGFYTGSVGN